MAPAEKDAYFGYNNGHDPTLLGLGTMVFDYANPRTKRPYFHPEVKELLENPPLATVQKHSYCAMSQARGRNYKLGSSLEGLLDFENSHANAEYRLVVGRDGSKIDVIRTDDFFTQVVLNNDKARLWLQSRLSVANKIHTLYKNVVSAPKIWLLTGVYILEDAVTYHVSSKSSTNSASVKVPIPEPTGLAALLGVTVGATASFGRGFEGQALSKVLGKQIWAAQWHQIDARYIYTKKADWSAESLGKQFEILDIMSLGNQRGDVDDIKLAEVHLQSSGGTPDDFVLDGQVVGAKAEYSDEMWQNFEAEIDDLLEELDESS